MIDVRVGLGQDTHAFAEDGDGRHARPLVLGGVAIPGGPLVCADSDGDLLLHALVRAIDTILGTECMGAEAERLAAAGTVDSRAYLRPALDHLARAGLRIGHVAVALEASRPRLREHFAAIRESVAQLVGVSPARVGISAESGDGLTECGRGRGLRAQVILTVMGPAVT